MPSSKPFSSRFLTKTLYILLFSLYMLHVPPISLSFIRSPKQYPVCSTHHKAPHYAVFSNPLSLPPSNHKCRPHHPVFEKLQIIFFSQCKRPGFTPTQNSKQNYSSVICICIFTYSDSRRVKQSN
jgi:hypothetical protein